MLQSIPESVTSAVGLMGVVIYLGSYSLLQLGILRGTSYTYSILNILAASSVGFSLIHAFNMSSLLIQASWVGISVVGITRVFLLTHFVRFSDEESAFIQSRFPDLAPHLARRYLNIGEWVDLQPGALLTQQNKAVEKLCYISKGEAEVIIDDEIVGKSKHDTVIGELSALNGKTAAATVKICEPTRAFVVDMAKLKKFLTSNHEIDFALRSTFLTAAREKLLERNADIKRLREGS